MKIYSYGEIPERWFCQWNKSSIFFALLNSGKFPASYFNCFEPDENFMKRTIEEKILFELEVMTGWAILIDYFPTGHKGVFYQIYSAFQKLQECRGKIDEKTYNKKVQNYVAKLRAFDDFFTEYEEKCLSSGTWRIRNWFSLKWEDFTSIDDLPQKSLVRLGKNHWVVFLEKRGENAIVVDAKLYDSYNKIPLSELNGLKIIKPKNIEIDSKELWMLHDSIVSPWEELHICDSTKFTRKITECIARIDQISFTEHDYNNFVKKAKSFLERLGKEHYKYEF